MDISSSAVTGTIRIGLQVLSSHRRPVIEIYHQLRNIYGPETEFHVPVGQSGSATRIEKTRSQEVIIQFFLVNIGSVRAENVKISTSGELKRSPPRDDFGKKANTVLPQLSPGQLHFLFKFDEFDLYEYPESGGTPIGLKKALLTITSEYDPPKSMWNRFMTLPYRMLGKRRYKTVYIFSSDMVEGDFPPAEYA